VGLSPSEESHSVKGVTCLNVNTEEQDPEGLTNESKKDRRKE